ncbi:MAG: ATP-binding protein [Peptococcaceae bacterium]|nr:ATP-binding protein [Peptococcaceae bacterium]
MNMIAKTPKKFNITGPCIQGFHYMVDIRAKIDMIIHDYIDKGEYFTINRARQYGKTTTLEMLYQRLHEHCVVLDLSFEGKDEYFISLEAFGEGFRRDVLAYKEEAYDAWAVWEDPIDRHFPMSDLSRRITSFCQLSPKKVILMVDEVDKASDNDVFLIFLGMLREKFISRNRKGIAAFQSVILAGVHDIKNLKKKLRPEAQHAYNSPWNIAANFTVDMSFSTEEIVTMLENYEQDYFTGMAVDKIAERLYWYTGGYPFLVSCVCKTIHERNLGWILTGVDMAIRSIIKENNTLFDDVIKNLMNHESFGELVEQILLTGEGVPFQIRNPDIDRGVMYGIFKEMEGRVRISNIVFETIIYDYFISIAKTRALTNRYADDDGSLFIHEGALDVTAVIQQFAVFMKSEYRDEDGSFIERHMRLLFLSFLKPIINGKGSYAVEAETRRNRRMDVVVFYGGEEHIIELKIWHGEKAAKEAYDQLTGYLLSRGQKRGYLVSFCDNRRAPREGNTFIHKDCEIVEFIVAYRDKRE